MLQKFYVTHILKNKKNIRLKYVKKNKLEK